jgi:hypothetical protein
MSYLPNGVDLTYVAPVSAKAKYETVFANHLPRGWPGSLPEGISLNWNPQPRPRNAITTSKPLEPAPTERELLANRSFLGRHGVLPAT